MITGYNAAGLVGLLNPGGNPQLVGLVHSIHCGVLRFMGGTVSQQRPTTADLAKAVAFAKECNLPVLWVANIFGAANDTITALKAFRAAGVEVIGVELGNETYTHDAYQELPGKYLRRAQLIHQAIHDYCGRNEVPLIPVSVVIAPSALMKDVGPTVATRLAMWNEIVMMAPWPDALSLHCYTTAVNASYYSQGLLPDFLSTLGARTNKAIWVTEHGLDDGHGTQVQCDHYLNTLDVLKRFPQVTIATAHNLLAQGRAYNFIEAQKNGPGKPITYSPTPLGMAAIP